MPDAKPHISPTQIESICRCGEAYRRSYIMGEKIPPKIVQIKGTCVHESARCNFSQKVDSHVDISLDDFKEMAAATFDKQISRGYLLTREEQQRGHRIVLGEAKDESVYLAELHAREQAPDYQPVDVEQEGRIELRNSTHDILMRIDMEDDQRRVVDFKTAARKERQSTADSSVQLTTYAAHHQLKHGSPPSEVRLDVLVKTKKPYRQVLLSQRGPDEFQALANRVNMVLATIKAGTFLPATPGAWWCSDDYCGYWSTCPYVNRNR